MERSSAGVSRRGMMAGLGAASGAAVLGAALPASAAPAGKAQAPSARLHPNTAPGGLAPASSSPEFGVSYQFRSWNDFFAEDDLLYGRKFGGYGMYTSASADYLAATFDLPAGAVLHDLEWYVSNTQGMNVYANVWQSSSAFLNTFWSTSIAAGTAGVRTHRFVIPSEVNGPYPHGTRLMVATSTPTTGTNQINGVRAGFKNGPRSTVLLPSPVRAYDSRLSGAGGPLGSAHSRTVGLAGVLPIGAVGALVNLTVTHTVGTGYLKLYASGTAAPNTSSINWFASGQTLANQATSAVSVGRSLTVTAGSHSADFIVDVLGYLV